MYANWMKKINLNITLEDIKEYEKRKKEKQYDKGRKTRKGII